MPCVTGRASYPTSKDSNNTPESPKFDALKKNTESSLLLTSGKRYDRLQLELIDKSMMEIPAIHNFKFICKQKS